MIFFVYTDGSCKGNPGKGGWGWVEYCNSRDFIIFTDYGGESSTTNNRMELTAIIEYLKSLMSNSTIVDVYKNSTIIIHSDSLYVLKSLVNGGLEGEIFLKGSNINYSGWLKGWKNKKFDGVKNKDLWMVIDKLLSKIGYTNTEKKLNIKLVFKYVKGHSISEGNNFADRLANKGASM